MANPQKENGFTPIANEILEAVSGAALNGTQLRILLLLWRNSYGYHKKECALPLSYLVKMLRGNKSTISRQMRRLTELGLVSEAAPELTSGGKNSAAEENRSIDNQINNRANGDGRTPKRYRFNKDYESWLCGAGYAGCTPQGSPSGLQGVGQPADTGYAGRLTDKDNKIYKHNFYSKNKFLKEPKTRRTSRYDYDEIERRTFLNVTRQLREVIGAVCSATLAGCWWSRFAGTKSAVFMRQRPILRLGKPLFGKNF